MFETSTINPHEKPNFFLSRALIVTRREIKDSIRDWRIITPIVSLTIVLPVVIIMGLRFSSELAERLGPETLNGKILPFAILAVGFFPMSFSLVIALETFVGEKERNSLEALLTAPLTDFDLFAGKYMAAIIPPVSTSSLGMFLFVGLVLLTGGPMPVSLLLLLVFWLLTVAQALVMVAGAIIVSSHTTSVRAANLLASFIVLPMSIVVQLEAIILLNGQKLAMLCILAGLVIVLVLLLRTGVKIFNREEIVAREGDTLSFKAILRNLASYFKRTPGEALDQQEKGLKPFSVWRLYRYDIPQIIAYNKKSIAVVLIGMLISVLVGVWVSTWPPIQQILSSRSGELSSNGENTIPICGTRGFVTWDGIFINNLRAVLLGSGAALFTLGIAGLLLLMVSVAPIGLIGAAFIQLKLNALPLLVGFVLPHGIIELPAAVIAFAAALQMGSAYIAPPKGFTIGGSLQFSIVNYIKLLALIVPLLLVAAILEANFTPAFGCWLTGGKF